MAYNQGYPGYPQQGGYPPQGQYPPPQQGHSPYPPQASPYSPPQQQGYYPPPGPSPHHQGGYGGHSPQPPHNPYGAPRPPPPQQQPYGGPGYGPGGPSPPPYSGPPQNASYGGHSPRPPYGAPSPQPPYGAPSPQPPYGGHSPQPPYGGHSPQPPYAQPHTQHQTPPSPGYNPEQTANVDTSRDADALRSAMKGFGTDDDALVAILTRIPDPLIMANLRQTYHQRHNRDLLADLHSETSGHFRETLQALARGPLDQDIHVLHTALEHATPRDTWLDDVLLARSNADLHAITARYPRLHNGTPLAAHIRPALSSHTSPLFETVLAATRPDDSTPIDPRLLDADLAAFHSHAPSILPLRSDGQIRALNAEHLRRTGRPLSSVVEHHFSGHLRRALLRMIAAGVDRAMADAESLEAAMVGAGTHDHLLLNRVVRLHWDRRHWGQVRAAYRVKYQRDLVYRVRDETSGHYERVLSALCEL